MLPLYLIFVSNFFDSSESKKLYPDKVSYAGSQVWQSYLKNLTDVNVIREIECNDDIQIWNIAAYTAQFLVKPDKMAKVRQQLKKNKLNYTVQIGDVNQLICNMFSENLEESETKDTGVVLDNIAIVKKLNWRKYPSWEVIEAYLSHIAEKHSEYVNLRSIGNSSENRPILMFKISNKQPENKPILIISGVHGHEWVAIASTLFILNSIATRFNELPSFLQNKDWYFAPVLNPDGYDYTHKVDRFWRKNRRCCKGGIGVDLAYNFAKFWGEDTEFGSQSCSASFEGPQPFSEPETKALKDYILEGCKTKPFHAFLDIQSYGQLIQFPWSATEKRTNDSWAHARVARVMRQMIYNRTKSTFHFTTGYDDPYPRFGVSIDWAYSLGILYSYVIKTRDTGEFGYLLPNKCLKEIAAELLQPIKYLAEVLDMDVIAK